VGANTGRGVTNSSGSAEETDPAAMSSARTVIHVCFEDGRMVQLPAIFFYH